MPYYWPKGGKAAPTVLSFPCSAINIPSNALGMNRSGPALRLLMSPPNICVVRLKLDAEASANALQEYVVHAQALGFLAESIDCLACSARPLKLEEITDRSGENPTNKMETSIPTFQRTEVQRFHV